MTVTPQQRLLDLLQPGTQATPRAGYLDVLGDAAQAGQGTGVVQRLMRNPALPLVYERYWRPFLGRIAKGLSGPTMADELSYARHKLALRGGDVAVDVACGTGRFTREFAAAVGAGGLAIGLDASRPMIERAVRSTPADAPVAYLRADAVRPPLRDDSVDGVCCFAALHLFDEPELALASFARVLRPGGRLVLLTSARHTGVPGGAVEAAIGRLTGMRIFGRLELRRLLRDNGFGEIAAVYAGATQLVAARLG